MTQKNSSHIHTHKSHDGIEYSHSLDDVQEHKHEHSDGHGHSHSHSHQNTKMVLNRLSRASGHLEAVKRMVEDGKDCTEVLIQLSAVIAALKSTGKVILADHIANCIVDAVESGDNKAIGNLNIAIDRFIK